MEKVIIWSYGFFFNDFLFFKSDIYYNNLVLCWLKKRELMYLFSEFRIININDLWKYEKRKENIKKNYIYS